MFRKCTHNNDYSFEFVPMKALKLFETRGPRGPWVAHLRKRSKVTVEQIIENPRGII